MATVIASKERPIKDSSTGPAVTNNFAGATAAALAVGYATLLLTGPVGAVAGAILGAVGELVGVRIVKSLGASRTLTAHDSHPNPEA